MVKLYIIAKRVPHYKPVDKLEVFRVLLALYFKSLLSIRKKTVSQKLFGYQVHAYSYQSLDYLFREIFVKQEYSLDIAQESPLIIDCGANIGMASMYFKRLYPDCRIIAIEANPHSFDLLRKNIEENHLEGITIIHACLSDKPGEVSFFFDQDKGSLAGSIHRSRGGQQEIKISSVKLSELIHHEEPDLVKIDVEGSEGIILKDLENTGSLRKSHYYIIEYHHNLEGSGLVLSEFLIPFEKEGYRFSMRSNFKEMFGFQDILIHLSRSNE
jgi:FkbM family methyltransferase